MLPLPEASLTVGLIVNKPTRLALREVFPGDDAHGWNPG